jgi:LmbE family N-acetylglucosaminyl deacetylase
VLCLGAHADDIEIGCGGTVGAMVARRPRPSVTWVVFSGGDGPRAGEARRGAAGILGPRSQDEVVIHSFRDGYFPAEYQEIKDTLRRIGRRARPDVVFTHTRSDRHQDHRVLSDLAWNEFRDQLILEYEIPKWDGDLGRPNAYVPLSARALARKLAVVRKVFRSQRAKDWFDRRTFEGLARLRGVECRAKSGFAEAFYLRKATLTVDS